MFYRTLTALLLAVISNSASAQTIAITGGKIFTVSGTPIENGTIVIKDGKILSVGTNVTIPKDAQTVNASGKWVTPGLVNSFTQLGVQEVASVPETRDVTA